MITAFILRGIDSTSPLRVSTGIRFHSSCSARNSSFLLLNFLPRTRRFKTSHKCSIGLRSGLWLGHFMTGMLTLGCRNHRFTSSDVCFGSLSCWNLSKIARFLFQNGNRFFLKISRYTHLSIVVLSNWTVKTSLKCTKNQRFLKITKVFSGTVRYPKNY